MGIFSGVASTSPRTITSEGFRVYVSRVVTPSTDRGTPPTYGVFTYDARLAPTHLFVGSSFGGPSRGALRFVPDVSDNLSVEQIGFLTAGDRVAVAVVEGGAPRYVWAGYVTGESLAIGEEKESFAWTLAGPEWIWGAGGRGGAARAIAGQVRRKADADEAWITAGCTPTAGATDYTSLIHTTNLPCVFNADGRPNMTRDDVFLRAAVVGRVFEMPDRRYNGDPPADVSTPWTVLQAAKFLATFANVTTETDITPPADFSAVLDDTQMPQTSVEGMGLWDALKRVCGSEFGFWIEPTPTIAGNSWGTFPLRFIRRGTGPNANFTLNVRGTSPDDAVASVTRLDARRDVGQVVNRVSVLGRRLKHVVLRYHGLKTDGLDESLSATSLQHGWGKLDAVITDYADTPNTTIDLTTLDFNENAQEWRDRYTTGGKLFDKYRNVFRYFTWNEAVELYGEGPVYGPSNTAVDWYAPNIAGVLGVADNGHHARSRRPMRDTVYRANGVDSFRRVSPAVFIGYQPGTDPDAEPVWRKLPHGAYVLDEQRAALWIVKDDLAVWTPFDTEKQDTGDEDDFARNDPRTFMSLLVSGALRLAVECCIECDDAELYAAEKTGGQSPFVREASYRLPDDFQTIDVYDDGQPYLVQNDQQTIDDTAAATDFATRQRSAGQDTQLHASILAAADWPGQAIGCVIQSVSGRNISLSIANSRYAQIVGATMDFESLKWEYLTESAALALKDDVRAANANRRRFRAGVTRGPGRPGEGATL